MMDFASFFFCFYKINTTHTNLWLGWRRLSALNDVLMPTDFVLERCVNELDGVGLLFILMLYMVLSETQRNADKKR